MTKQVYMPVWAKYMLSIEEAALYFRIGENKLRRLIAEHSDADWLFRNGNRTQIKRKKFEALLNEMGTI